MQLHGTSFAGASLGACRLLPQLCSTLQSHGVYGASYCTFVEQVHTESQVLTKHGLFSSHEVHQSHLKHISSHFSFLAIGILTGASTINRMFSCSLLLIDLVHDLV